MRLRKASPTVLTVALEDLPVGTKMLDRNGDVWQVAAWGDGPPVFTVLRGYERRMWDNAREVVEHYGPLKIVWRPERAS